MTDAKAGCRARFAGGGEVWNVLEMLSKNVHLFVRDVFGRKDMEFILNKTSFVTNKSIFALFFIHLPLSSGVVAHQMLCECCLPVIPFSLIFNELLSPAFS